MAADEDKAKKARERLHSLLSGKPVLPPEVVEALGEGADPQNLQKELQSRTPIQFRDAKLHQKLQRRLSKADSIGGIAKNYLDQYLYVLFVLQQDLRVRFTRDELGAVFITADNDADPQDLDALWMDIQDARQLGASFEINQEALAEKVRKLSVAERFALIDLARVTWMK